MLRIGVPRTSRTLAATGAEVIVVQSATTTFQGSWAPKQHAALATVRAVESVPTVIHATLSGVAAAFYASGRRHLWFGTDRIGADAYTRRVEWVSVAAIGLRPTGAVLLRRCPS